MTAGLAIGSTDPYVVAWSDADSVTLRTREMSPAVLLMLASTGPESVGPRGGSLP